MKSEELNNEWKELVSKMDKLQLERFNIEKAIGDVSSFDISNLMFKARENGFIRDQNFDKWVKKESMAERMERLNSQKNKTDTSGIN